MAASDVALNLITSKHDMQQEGVCKQRAKLRWVGKCNKKLTEEDLINGIILFTYTMHPLKRKERTKLKTNLCLKPKEVGIKAYIMSKQVHVTLPPMKLCQMNVKTA